MTFGRSLCALLALLLVSTPTFLAAAEIIPFSNATTPFSLASIIPVPIKCIMSCGYGYCNDFGVCVCPPGFETGRCAVCIVGFFLVVDPITKTGSCVPCSECPSASHDCLPSGCDCKSGWDRENGCTSCRDGYYGAKCQPCDALTTCSGHGSCSDGPSLCECDASFEGDQCQQCKPNYYPSPLFLPDPSVGCSTFCHDDYTCYGQGTCNSTGHCVCRDGWSGPECLECLGPEHNYYGTDCHYCESNSTCNGQPCSNHRGSGAESPCACGTRFTGVHCEYCAVYHYDWPNCTECTAAICNNRGSCLPSGLCRCDIGFTGRYCADCRDGFYGEECSPCGSCGDGVCSDTKQGDGSCICNRDAVGSNCEFTRQDTCHGHGSPKTDGTCLCDSGFAPPNCDQCALYHFTAALNCSRRCEDPITCGVHGGCNPEGLCQCDIGYALPNCTICATDFYPVSTSPLRCEYCHVLLTCNMNGQCRPDATCQCEPGHEPRHCDVCSPGYYKGSGGKCIACPTFDGKICGGRGYCNATVGCVCTESWGPACSSPVITHVSDIITNRQRENGIFVYGKYLPGKDMPSNVSFDSVMYPSANGVVERFCYRFDPLADSFMRCNWHGVAWGNGTQYINFTVKDGGESRTYRVSLIITLPKAVAPVYGQLASTNEIKVLEDRFGPEPQFLMVTDTDLELSSFVSDINQYHRNVTLPPLNVVFRAYTVINNSTLSALSYRMDWKVGLQRGKLSDIVYRMPTLVLISFINDILVFSMSDLGMQMSILFHLGSSGPFAAQVTSDPYEGPIGLNQCYCSVSSRICQARLPSLGSRQVPFYFRYYPNYSNINLRSNNLSLDYPLPVSQSVTVTGCPMIGGQLYCESTGIDVLTITGRYFGEEFHQDPGPITPTHLDMYFESPEIYPCSDVQVVVSGLTFTCRVPKVTFASRTLMFRAWSYGRRPPLTYTGIVTVNFVQPKITNSLTPSPFVPPGNVVDVPLSGTLVQFTMKGISRAFFNGAQMPQSMLWSLFRFWLVPHGATDASYTPALRCTIMELYLQPSDPGVDVTVMLPPFVGSGHHLRGAFTIDVGASNPFFVESTNSPGTVSYIAPSILPNTLCHYPGGNRTDSLQSLSSSGGLISFDVTNAAYIELDSGMWRFMSVVMFQEGQLQKSKPCVVMESLSTPESIVCRTPPGEGRDYVFALQNGDELVEGTDRYHYPTRPKILSVQGCADQGNATVDCPTSAIDANDTLVLLTITGTDFGGIQTATVGTETCPLVRQDGNSVVCQLPPGTGLNKAVILLGNQVTSPPFESVSYAFPTISQVVGCGTSEQPCDRNGNTLIEVHGTDLFGSSILIGGAVCELVELYDDYLVCNVPSGSGSDLPLMAIQNDGGASDPIMFYYVKCRVGQYSQENSTSCFQCEQGFYNNLEGLSFCMECQAGTYSAQLSASTCAFCAPGRFTDGTRRTNCSACPLGKYSGAGASVCDDCQAGTYEAQGQCLPCPLGSTSNLLGQIACQPCSAGKYMPSPGSALSSCSDCPAGYESKANASSCVQCRAGYYSSQGSSACGDCPWGFFTELPGQAQCTPCDAGKFSETALSTTCLDCAVGKFSRTGSGLCENCPVGRIAAQRGMPSCVSCASGLFINSTGASVCAQCPVGTYSVSPASTESPTTQCPACAPGRYQPISGSTSCSLCNSGKFSNASQATRCWDCEEGSWSSSTGGFTACSLCAAGKFQDLKGQADCQSCPGGYHSLSSGATICALCAIGTYASPLATACLECLPGKFGSAPGVCDPCPTGRFSNVSKALTCGDCRAGHFATQTGKSSCDACPEGTFSSSGSTRCESCAEGKYTPRIGSSECMSCSVGRWSRLSVDQVGIAQCSPCSAGSYISYEGASYCLSCLAGKVTKSSGQSICSNCEAGKYQPGSAASACLDCSAGSISSSTGQIACTACTAGSIAPRSGMSICDSCQAGRYANAQTNNQCIECPEGSSSSSRSSSCSACSAGKFSNATGSDNCLHCPMGRFQNEPGQASCKEAPRGSSVSFSGAVNHTPCSAGSFSNMTGLTACESCEPGSYIGSRGSSFCMPAREGAYVSLKGGMSEVKCEAGLFQNETGASFCHRCPEGYYQNTTGSTACEEVPIGYFSNRLGVVDPIPCEAGTYSNLTGLSVCVRCEMGRFVDHEAASACLSCQKGAYSSSLGLSSCVFCSEGSFAAATGLTTCVNCPVGKQAPLPGAERCVDCVPGSFAPSTGTAVCRPCAAGSYQNLTGKSECAPCPPGFAQETPGQTSCTICPIGSYAPSSAQSNCNPAPVGRFTNTNGSTEATRCRVGSYQDEEGQTSCKPCSPGSFASSAGLENCLPCSAGMFSAATNASACHSCAAGSYQPNPFSSSCLLCNVGSYSSSGASVCSECTVGYAPDEGMDRCLDCPSFSRTIDQGSKCSCLSGFYSVYDEAGRLTCPACPPGANCEAEGNERDTLTAASGYWRVSNSSLHFLKCRVAEYCLGGFESTCLGNRDGPLCMLCKPGYQASSDRRCNECPGGGGAPSAGLFVLYALIILAAIIVLCAGILFTEKQLLAQFERYLNQWIQEHGSRRITNFAFDEARASETDGQTNDLHSQSDLAIQSATLQPTAASSLPHPSIALSPAYVQKRTLVISDGVVKPADNHSRSGAHRMKIFISFFQIVSTVAFLFDAPWPTLYRKFLSVFNFLNLDLVHFSGASCVWEINFYTQFLVVLISPLVLMLVITLYFVGGQWLKLRLQSADLPERQLGMRLALAKNLKIFFFVMFLVYPRVSTMTLSLLNCSNVEGRHYLSVDFSIECYDSRWYNYLVFDIFMILLYPIGFPAFLFYLLRRARQRSILQRVDVVYYMGFLYQPYNDNAYMFELVEMGHKLILTSLLSVFPTDAQLPLGMAVSAAFFIVIVLARPYSSNGDETVHLLAQCNIFLLLFAGWFFTQGGGELDSVADDAFSIFLILTTVVFLLGFVYAAGVRLRVILLKAAGFLNERLSGKQNAKSTADSSASGEEAVQMQKIVSGIKSASELTAPPSPNIKPSRILDMGIASAALDAQDLPMLERQASSPSLNARNAGSDLTQPSVTVSSGLPMLVSRLSPFVSSLSVSSCERDALPPLSLDLSGQASLLSGPGCDIQSSPQRQTPAHE